MRWAGKVGYAHQEETSPGNWEDVITEVDAKGILLQTTEPLDSGDSVLPRYRTTTSVSILANGRRVPSSGIRYITWDGERWQVSTVVRQPPRFVIYIGEVYRGPIPE